MLKGNEKEANCFVSGLCEYKDNIEVQYKSNASFRAKPYEMFF